MSKKGFIHSLASGDFQVEILDPQAPSHWARFDRSGVVSHVRLRKTDFMSAEFLDEAASMISEPDWA